MLLPRLFVEFTQKPIEIPFRLDASSKFLSIALMSSEKSSITGRVIEGSGNTFGVTALFPCEKHNRRPAHDPQRLTNVVNS
jgi:hypothetical protein